MPLRCAVLTFLVLAGAARADSFHARIVPAAPTNLTPVVVELWGLHAHSDVPGDARVRIRGSRIELDVNASRGGGVSAETEWAETVQLGALPPGDYELAILYPRGFGQAEEQLSFAVRDVTTLPILDPVIPESSTRMVDLEWSRPQRHPVRVWFGGREGSTTVCGAKFCPVGLRPPPSLAPGLHDVQVEWEDGTVDISRNAVLVRPAGDFTPFGMRYLLPVYTEGAGAEGTLWRSSLSASPALVETLARRAVEHGRPAGVWLDVPPRSERELELGLRIGENGKPLVSVPIVRETEFRGGPRITEEVPFGGDARVTLRIYSLEPATFRVSTDTLVTTVRYRPDEPAFAILQLPSIPHSAMRGIAIDGSEPFWAMVSSFNAGTHALTIGITK